MYGTKNKMMNHEFVKFTISKIEGIQRDLHDVMIGILENKTDMEYWNSLDTPVNYYDLTPENRETIRLFRGKGC